eukprot:CAMPEP_0206295594 /NCGR_PEP_ID=MMETSP0106_2-20121207/5245_1 /ASSEMBLY_ACC=CAM_ASM_000206 /TAXON_ID=81532 /ORGANISM="Acanthoeca-like sp., Strain 10tr" /LENGTH=2074 /DNA_ID=CAMNT_0053726249 /DNA_START=150 /DNA_END=6370 /DNA_ORIENTATION=-
MADAARAIISPKMAAKGQRPQDGVPDMTAISDIDVKGVNTNLKVRFKRNEIYTYTGTILVAVNPYKVFKIYEPDTMKRYHGRKMGDLPPHVFATAQAAYLNVQNSNQNQSCVISGESGAGKTETTKFILQYLCTITSTTSNWVEQQILECNTILEAFGNAKTVRNDNSSRFGKFMQVCFSKDIEIKGMIVQEYLLEQSRITYSAEGERNYHVFYQLCKGGDKKQFQLMPMDKYNYVNQSGCYDCDGVSDEKGLEELRVALTVLHIDDDVQDGLFSLVSAVLATGNFQFADVDGESVKLTPADDKLVTVVASLLGIKKEALAQTMISRTIIVRGSATIIPLKLVDAHENKHAMAKALYSRTFTWLVDKINQTTNPGKDTQKFIGVLDIFGFENFKVNSFEQLCINFTNEKLHKFFNHYVFALEQAEYEREGIDFAHIQFTDNTECLELIEKPPMCVLKLLDEECKIPRGSDGGFLEKLNSSVGKHKHYAMPPKGNARELFGIHHFAGKVMYTVDGFLDKNKDTDQGGLFELMRDSSVGFVKDVTQFQDMLSMERNMIAGSKASAMDRSGSRRSTMTNKAKPTIGDTFRRQLHQLNQILNETTPWYVRCIKPNSTKSPMQFEDQLVIDQLNYSGMLDIVRIRREGFPVHVPAEIFVAKYGALAVLMQKTLDDDAKKAAAQILSYIGAPTTEWQIGKTKVFLRNSVFEPLEEKLIELLQRKVVLIQKTWRGYKWRKRYQKIKISVVRIQAAVTGATYRMVFVRKRRAAVSIQAWWRMIRAREFVKALKIKRRKEIERRRKEEEERRKKMLQEKGEALMEDSFLAAQKELYAMAAAAETKAAATATPKGAGVDLDNVFSALAKDASNNDAGSSSKKLEADLDALLSGAAPGGTVSIRKGDGVRTIRRKKRIQKKVEEVEEQGVSVGPIGAEPVGPGPEADDIVAGDYPLIEYAEKYFNDWPKKYGSTLTRRRSSATIKAKALVDPMPKSEMLKYTDKVHLPTSLTKMHNPENTNVACHIFKDLFKYMQKKLDDDKANTFIQTTVAWGIEREELRDELYCQVMKQASMNLNPDEQERAWSFLCMCCVSFPPRKSLYPYVKAFIKPYERDQMVGPTATFSLDALKKVNYNGPRRYAPSTIEIQAIMKLQPIICRFYFLDGQAKAIGVHPSWTAADVIAAIAAKIGLQNTAGWALFESTPQVEHFIRNHEYVGDILAQWEAEQRTSMKMTKYQTVSRKGATQALGLGDARFVFRKRLFLDPKSVPTDPMEYRLLYYQAVHCVTRADEFPITDADALRLAGLQAQVNWGEADKSKLTRYNDIYAYLPRRLAQSKNDGEPEFWKEQLFEAHQKYGRDTKGAWFTDLRAMTMYLTLVKQFPQYGGAFFDVQYKGFWTLPNRLLLSIDVTGFKFIHLFSKAILKEYTYAQLDSVAVNAMEHTLTLNMKDQAAEVKQFMFLCPRMDDVANMIASYSPSHRNWKQVGMDRAKDNRISDEDKSKLAYAVTNGRAHLSRTGLLKPAEQKTSGFTTLRRRSSKTSLTGDSSYEEMYPEHYWKYHKRKINQTLTIMNSVESEEIALRNWVSLLIFAGLETKGGYEEPNDTGMVLMVQAVIQNCLEKEDICNEFYVQLIKQTTDQPDPNSRINVANWRFFVLTLCVVVPRNPSLLAYMWAHLRRCSAETNEEGKYAQFAQKCLQRTLDNANRKYPPSKQEIASVMNREQVFSRFYFMDGTFRPFSFDPAQTTAEVVALIKERIGLPSNVQGFSLFEVFGSLARNMLPYEKVADAIYKWEKYGRKTRSPAELRLTFKKRLFVGPHVIPKNNVEFDLIMYQAIDDVKCDRYPLLPEEVSQLVAIHAQLEQGNWEPTSTYTNVVERYIPQAMESAVDMAEVIRNHKLLKDRDVQTMKTIYMKFIMNWKLYGATVFDVQQSYSGALPKQLWLAVDEEGIHIMKRRSKVPMITYPYKDIVNYSPSLKNLMIVTESMVKGTKFIFTTKNAAQIAYLIKDYTYEIIKRNGGADTEAEAGFAAAPPTLADVTPALPPAQPRIAFGAPAPAAAGAAAPAVPVVQRRQPSAAADAAPRGSKG